MRLVMVKKRLADGSDCRKCAEATAHLRSRGLWDRIHEIVWAQEGDPSSPGVVLGERLGVERAPFFVVQEDDGTETVYTSVLQLVHRLGAAVTADSGTVDPDDVGGI
ncbi:MAG TPA: hypothetical protein VGK30_01140 [Candidatus Binatia bacterium]|jgi:hypothetical protein